MSKGNSYLFKGTKGELISTIASLPPKPNRDFLPIGQILPIHEPRKILLPLHIKIMTMVSE